MGYGENQEKVAASDESRVSSVRIRAGESCQGRERNKEQRPRAHFGSMKVVAPWTLFDGMAVPLQRGCGDIVYGDNFLGGPTVLLRGANRHSPRAEGVERETRGGLSRWAIFK